jgi:hypothetical protein
MSTRAAVILAGAALIIGGLIGRASANTATKPAQKSKPATSHGLDPTVYPRTMQGAATAAQAYNEAFMGAALMTPDERRAVINTIGSDGMSAQLEKEDDQAAELLTKLFDLPKDADQVVRRLAPLGWRVVAFTKDSARVELWTITVFGKPGVGNGIAPVFKTSTYDLAWERNAWRLAGLPESNDGPTPTADNPQASADVAATVRNLQEFTHAAR